MAEMKINYPWKIDRAGNFDESDYVRGDDGKFIKNPSGVKTTMTSTSGDSSNRNTGNSGKAGSGGKITVKKDAISASQRRKWALQDKQKERKEKLSAARKKRKELFDKAKKKRKLLSDTTKAAKNRNAQAIVDARREAKKD